MKIWEKNLAVGKTDNYSITINPEWLGSETLSNATAISDQSGTLITLGTTSIVGGSISVPITGIAAGYSKIEFDFNTATRSDCFEATLYTKEC